MGYRLEPDLNGEAGEATAIEQEVEWLVQIETGSILSGVVRQSTKTINVSTAVCALYVFRSEHLPVLYLHLPGSTLSAKRRQFRATG